MNATITITQLSGTLPGRTLVVRQSQVSADGPTAYSAVITTSEALSAGDLVNVWNNAGALAVRRASAASAGLEASGFVLVDVGNAQPATVHFAGRNDSQSGMTAGRVFLSTTPGRATATPPTGVGQVVQPVGYALSATTLVLQLGTPIRLT